MRSYKVQQKASQVGFDWKDIDSVFEKVYEEINELRDVYKSKDVERINDELGDVLFSIVNLSRFLKVQPELALMGSVNKFIEGLSLLKKRRQNPGEPFRKCPLMKWTSYGTRQRQKLRKFY